MLVAHQVRLLLEEEPSNTFGVIRDLCTLVSTYKSRGRALRQNRDCVVFEVAEHATGHKVCINVVYVTSCERTIMFM